MNPMMALKISHGRWGKTTPKKLLSRKARTKIGVMQCVLSGSTSACRLEKMKTRPSFLAPLVRSRRIASAPLSVILSLGKEKHTPPCSNAELFFAEKKRGPQRKDFGGRYGFPGFHRVFVSTTNLESFSSRPEKFPKRFSFGGGRVRFFLLC